MSTIYIGSIYMPEQIDELKSLGSHIDYAAETFQTSLIQGLYNYYPELKIITAPNISSYPKINKTLFKKKEFYLTFSSVKHLFTGFINVPILKHISKIVRVRKAIKLSLNSNSNNIIIIYGVHSPFLMSLCGINKKKYKSCLIVPDLPVFMSENTNRLYLLGKMIDGLFIRRGIKHIDSYALFSIYMLEKMKIGTAPWTQIEGIYCNDVKVGGFEKEQCKTILYTGSLSKRYGIMNLVKAFGLIEDADYRLWVCGGGNAIEDIKKAQIVDNRIQYFGLLTKSEVRTLQKKATLLINPRNSTDEYTKYSFPSKTMEYMASGTPTLMAKLASIPQEYKQHIYFFDDESIEGMKNKIIEICEKPQSELDAFGKAASEFILNEKNEKKQAKKIVELINSI